MTSHQKSWCGTISGVKQEVLFPGDVWLSFLHISPYQKINITLTSIAFLQSEKKTSAEDEEWGRKRQRHRKRENVCVYLNVSSLVVLTGTFVPHTGDKIIQTALKLSLSLALCFYNKKRSVLSYKTTKNIPGFSSLTLWSQDFRSKPQFNLYISMEWCNLNRQSFSFFSPHPFTLHSSLSCLG